MGKKRSRCYARLKRGDLQEFRADRRAAAALHQKVHLLDFMPSAFQRRSFCVIREAATLRITLSSSRLAARYTIV
ncbi:MAG: hypothetical protein E5W97_32875 [Mesorhizobium sp.]|nr:MAG: hypothetical protein E5W97_32875 [Mesorhizobium sp.]